MFKRVLKVSLAAKYKFERLLGKELATRQLLAVAYIVFVHSLKRVLMLIKGLHSFYYMLFSIGNQ